MENNYANNDANNSAAIANMSGRFKGVWDINGVLTDTLMVASYSYNFGIFGLPFKDITRYIYPDLEITKITDEVPVGIQLVNEDAMWLKTLVDYGDNKVCLTSYVCYSLALVGYSQTMAYFEYPAVEGYAYRYYPYVVTPADGNYFAVVLDVIPHESKVALDLSTQTISCTLVIRKVEIINQNGDKTVKTLSPEMKLTFTTLSKTGN